MSESTYRVKCDSCDIVQVCSTYNAAVNVATNHDNVRHGGRKTAVIEKR